MGHKFRGSERRPGSRGDGHLKHLNKPDKKKKKFLHIEDSSKLQKTKNREIIV